MTVSVPSTAAAFPKLRRALSDGANEWNRVGRQGRFYAATLRAVGDACVHYRTEILRQIAQMSLGTGALALIGGTVVIVGFLTFSAGALIAVQGYNSLAGIGAEALTGFASAYLNVRLIAPLTAGIGLAATIGAGATAQLGAMRISEEIDALEVMGIRAVAYLASTRLVAGVIVVIPLYCLAIVMSFTAARVGTTLAYGQSTGVYDHYFSTFLNRTDILWSFLQAVTMATIVLLIHTYYGFTASGGPAGVGEAVGRAVRASLVSAIFVTLLVSLSIYGQSGNFHFSGMTAMDDDRAMYRLHPGWWTAIMIAIVIGLIAFTAVMFTGSLRSYVPVTLTSDRSGLVMETGAQVRLRGIEVGRVGAVHGGLGPVRIDLQIDPDQIRYIPANIEGQIRAGTAFGPKFVDLVYPSDPSPQRLTAGARLSNRQVSTETNTVFANLVGLLKQVDPAKLNGVLTAVADAVRGKGAALGETITASVHTVAALNARTDTIDDDIRGAKGLTDAYGGAAQNILRTIDAATTTSAAVNAHTSDLDALLLNAIGLSRSGIDLLGPNKDILERSVNILQPTTDLLAVYNPEYTCSILGVEWLLDKTSPAWGANGYSATVDAGLGWGSDPYRYPDNLPVVAAKGGPGGKPGCGSLPDVSKNYPAPYLVTDTGFGTGLDVRPNPGLGSPCWADYLPVTRAVPEPASIRKCLPGPAPGPEPYPGAPPYGAALYGPGGTPLYPGVPPAPQSGPVPEPSPDPTPSEGRP